MLRSDYVYEQPSRWSRVLILATALAVGLMAVWVLTPIVLAGLTPTSSTVSPPRRAVSLRPEQPSAADETKALAALPAPIQSRPQPEPVTARAPEPPPQPAYVAASPSALGISGEAATPAPTSASEIPWPVPQAGIEPAAGPAAVAAAPIESFGHIPLPRRRPAIADRFVTLDIPIPRPRPEPVIEDVPPAPEPREPATDRLRTYE